MMWPINRTLLAITATLISFAGCAWIAYANGKKAGAAQVQAKWNVERLATAEAQAEELAKARQRESALRDLSDKSRKAKDDEIRTLNLRHAAVLDSLHNRPDSPTGSSGPGLSEAASTGPATGWCDGSRLYRDHATVLVGEAAVAAELQAYARYCVQQYEAVRR